MDIQQRPAAPQLEMQILRKYEELSRAERKVADVVILKGPQLLGSSIQELAQESKVSEPTVLRFCRTMGYSGLKSLKQAAATVEPPRSPQDAQLLTLDQVDSADQLVPFVLDSTIQVLQETRKLLDSSLLAQAVRLIDQSHYIGLMAVGGSSVVARHAQHYLRMMGMHVNLFSPFDPLSEQYSPGDAVLAVSYSGNTPVVVDAVRSARESGAQIICITSWGSSKLQQLAHVCLQTPYGHRGLIQGFNAIERSAQMAIVDILISGLCLHRKQQLKD